MQHVVIASLDVKLQVKLLLWNVVVLNRVAPVTTKATGRLLNLWCVENTDDHSVNKTVGAEHGSLHTTLDSAVYLLHD